MLRLPKISTLVPAAAGVAAFWVSTEPAFGFFPPITNDTGAGTVTTLPPPVNVIPPPVLISPPPPPPFVSPPPPPVITPPTVTPQGNPDPMPTCSPPVTPQATPEPATVVSGLIGLAAVSGAAWRRKRGQAAA